jgi:long-chain acyl-CoA synthetase
MQLDLELYRREVRVSTTPLVRLSAIDIAPDHAQRTMVFVHGFAGQATQWRYQLEHFAAANRVIAIDLRGHGRSETAVRDYSMAEVQSDLAQVLQILGVQPGFILIGHSFGGAVVTEYAVAHPQEVAQLILIATAGEFHLSRLLRTILGLPTRLLRLLQPAARGWTETPLPVLQAWYRNTLSQWNGWSLFRSVTVPTLVIRGHWDLLFEKPMFDEVPGAIPNAEDLDVGSSKHMVMLERRDAVNRAIERFVEGETTRSWRPQAAASPNPTQLQLRQSRPWLAHYDTATPDTVAVPPIAVQHLLRSAVRRFPQRTALYFEGAQLSYRGLNREVNRFANALCAMGLGHQERVMLLMPNLPQTVIAFYATLKAGGVVVMAPLDLATEELAEIARSTEAKIVIAWHGLPELSTLLHDLLQGIQVILAQTGSYLPLWKRSRVPQAAAISGTHEFTTLLQRQSTRSPQVETTPDELALIQYTSGTTGKPKGVMLTHRNLVANTLQTRHWMKEAQEGQERFLCVLPFFHIYGLTTSLNLPIALGATLYLKARFDVLDILKSIQQHQPTVFAGVPTMYLAIKNYPGVRKYGISSIKACLSGSAPLPLEIQEAFEKLTRGRLIEGYGLTEAAPVTHGTPLHGLRKPGSIGIPLPSTEARVVSLEDRIQEAAVGQIGELAVRGPQIMAGYWCDPVATAEVLDEDGWLLTGDVAQMDSDGYFHLIARKVELWHPAGQGTPAFPRDVEEVLFEIPQVREAAVVAVDDQPIAFVITGKESISADAIIAYCRKRLPPELIPVQVIFVGDFPRNFIGKVLRRELAERMSQTPLLAPS